ncbi:MAG TPA: hypothetical protein VGM17_14595 [Rhizomicrobium sp.]
MDWKFLEDATILWTTGAILLTLLLFTASSWGAFVRSYRLLRTVRQGRGKGGRLRTFGELAQLLLRTRWWLLRYGRPTRLYQTVRLRTEYDLFHSTGPRPKLYWDNKAQVHSATDDAGAPFAIPVQTCNQIYEHRDDIQRYFDALKATGDSDNLQFLCDVVVRNGFVAPLLLLTGLLHHYDDDWAPIIDAYGRDVDPTNDPLTARLRSGGLRRLQTFLFDCWLLWGPSIPICHEECDWWKGDIGAVQYGYGDENNSIALVGDLERLRERLRHGEPRGAAAFRATARGRLRLAEAIMKEAEQSELSPALNTAWSTEKGRRLVLDLRPEHSVRILAGDLNQARTTYYSAYLWVLLIVLDTKNPIHMAAGPKKQQDWRSFLPFFEHGNIAEGYTLGFLKRQLANKVANSLQRLVESYEAEWKERFPLRFAYACAIDDSGCGMPKAYDAGDNQTPLRDLLADLLGKYPSLTDIVDFEIYSPAIHPDNHPYSACSLPEQLASYYPFYTGDQELR